MLELSLESWVEMLRWKSVWDDGRRKPWKFGPVHRPPLMQRKARVGGFNQCASPNREGERKGNPPTLLVGM